jgi:hypothetical protein
MGTKKYVIELTKNEHSAVCEAMWAYSYDVEEGATTQNRQVWNRAFGKVVSDLRTKAQYLRENKNGT